MTKKMPSSTNSFHLKAKKSLGQNFLKDEKIIQSLVSFVDNLFENNNKYVHEIGPGTGAITFPMLERGIHVTALEKDVRAIQGLLESISNRNDLKENFKLIQTDILKWSPLEENKNKPEEKPICVGNIPYYITSDILMWLCKHKSFYKHGIFMVQNEVADRLQANKGTKDYGRLTIKMQLYFDIKKVLFVPAHCFAPKPQVDSAVILLTPKTFAFDSEQEEKFFERFTATLFSARRKMLRRALHAQLEQLVQKGPEILSDFWKLANEHHVFEDTRPDAIGPLEVLELHRFLYKNSQ